MEGYVKFIMACAFVMVINASCTLDTNEVSIPPVSEQKSSLEAAFASQAPNSINSSYWTTADYVKIPVKNVVTQQVEETDGLLNMNGMYNGLEDFNQGSEADLTLKAAYDDVNLYVLVAWQDKTFNVSQANWLYNGPEDPHKNDDRFGWTSQRSDDDLILSFEKNAGEKDVWKWSLALSEPVGYAVDMHGADFNWTLDGGTPSYVRNAMNSDDDRSGPKYQWSGDDQQLNRDPAGSTILDPAFYLMNKSDFTGDIIEGESVFQVACGFCHGKGGEGNGAFHNTGVALNVPGWLNRYTQTQLDNIIGNVETHTGARYWNGLTSEEQTNLGARLKAFAGIPGYVLQMPSGSSADVKATSNVQLARINVDNENSGYKLLLIRKLNTGNDDDIQFTSAPGTSYSFGIYLSDNDNLNLVGGADNQLIFVK